MVKINLLSLILVLASCTATNDKDTKTSRVEALPYYYEATFTPLWLDADDPVLDTLHRIPSFQLIDQLGDTITEQTVANKIYVVDFFFTFCPGICPRMTSNMAIIQDEFYDDNDILLLSHSVTPTRDSVPVLHAYAENKGIDAKRWHIVTGKRSDIYKLGRAAYFVEEDLGLTKDPDEFLHTENFVLIDKHRHIRGIYNGLNKSSIQQLIADIKTLKREQP